LSPGLSYQYTLVQSFIATSVLPFDADDVFRYHAAPGAFERLIPPWENIRIRSKSGGITDGSRLSFRVRKGPIWVPWVAVHSSYVQGRQFVDEQTHGPFRYWRHTHSFTPGKAPGTCILEDRVEYRLGTVLSPLASGTLLADLRRMFAFRHARTRRDLERIVGWRNVLGPTADIAPKRIVLTGASGSIGAQLAAILTVAGHRVERLVRHKPNPEAGEIFWQPGLGTKGGQIDAAALEGADAVIHLAGESVALGRWTARKMQAIRDSRVEGTLLLARTLAGLQRRPGVLLVASGTGYYGDRGEEELIEAAGVGSGFLAEVSRDWEAASDPARQAGIRTASLRIGLALTPASGLLKNMLPWFNVGLGLVPGSGQQWWPWIGMDDLLSSFVHIIADPTITGPVNCVSPAPVRAREFVGTLAAIVDRPIFAKAPPFAMRAAFGPKAEPILSSCRAVPDQLRRAGFRCQQDTLAEALRWEMGLISPALAAVTMVHHR
jgi:uncharacterized protein